MSDPNNLPDDLADILPPESTEPVEALPELAAPAKKPLTDDDIDAINDHINMVIEAAAAAGAETMPPELREPYQASFTTSPFVRAGVVMTGIGPALHELMPSDGAEAAAPVRELHPLVRVLLGVAVLGVATLAQRKVLLANYEKSGADSRGPAGSGSTGNAGQSGPKQPIFAKINGFMGRRSTHG